MSVHSLSWAFKQQIGKSSAKFVLVALANYANEDGRCYPSVERLTDDTDLDRKTIISALAMLCADGWIEDTGERCGATHQVKVYRLCFERTEPGEVNHTMKTPPVPSNSRTVKHPENGTVKACQKRNSTRNGTVPFLEGNSTVFPMKESQIWDTEPLEEPSEEPAAAGTPPNNPLPAVTKPAAAASKPIKPELEPIPDIPLLEMTDEQLADYQRREPVKLAHQFEREHPDQRWRDRIQGRLPYAKNPPVFIARVIVQDLLLEIRRERERAAQTTQTRPLSHLVPRNPNWAKKQSESLAAGGSLQ